MTAVEEFSLGQRRGKWVLVIHAPDLTGEVVSSQRWVVEGVAKAYRQMQRKTAVKAVPDPALVQAICDSIPTDAIDDPAEAQVLAGYIARAVAAKYDLTEKPGVT
jgi:hypothetical protein